MKLTIAERVLIGQIINVKMSSATLKEHIRLETIFKAVDVENAKLPAAIDYVEEDQKELFKKYDGQQIASIKDKEAAEILQEAMKNSAIDREKIWANEEEADFNAELSNEDLAILRNFFERAPDPVAVLTFDSLDFRKMIFKMANPAGLWAKGRITAEGSWIDALKFLGRFDTSA